MAITQNLYTGNGSTTNYSFTFEYLVQADVKATLDGTATTAFTFPNATTLAFSTAPANGVAIRIFRDTNINAINATFFPGSAIKAEDLNSNFTQNNFATQETDNEVIIANTTAASAVTTANAANTKSDASVTTANTASTNASAAVTTANTASTNATTAVNTANTASTNATTAVNTANAATTTANGAVTTANAATATANTASTNASAAVTTANTASTNASAAVTTANTANTTAGNAVTTANTASTNATSAVTTANGAVTTANTADTNASAAVTTANAASAAVSAAVLFTIVANVAAIPGSPSNGDPVEVSNSTGIESFSPLNGLPSGFVGASGLTVRINYNSSSSSWVFLNYFANDSEDRYFKKTGGTFTGDVSFDDNIIAKGDNTNGSGQITLNCEVNTHGVKIKGPPHSAGADYTLTLPNDDGNSNDLLKTDGNGVLSWLPSTAANITNTASGNLAATNVQGALNELQGDINSNVTNIAARLPLAGGTMTGDIVFNSGQTIVGYTPRTSATGSSNLSVGTTGQRDGSPAAGMVRYNTTTSEFEGYSTGWAALAGGALLKVNRLENTTTTDGGIDIDSSGHVELDGLQMPTAGALSNRNLITNGSMQVAQRGTSLANTVDGAYLVDRFKLYDDSANTHTLTQSQSSNVPNFVNGSTGFSKSLRVEVTSGAATPTTGYTAISQSIEGFDAVQLQYGTANAKTVTLSFWVRTNVSANYSVALRNSALNYAYIAQFGHMGSNAWFHIKITVPGATAGTWLTDNSKGLEVLWTLDTGSNFFGTKDAWNTSNVFNLAANTNNWSNTTGNYFELTGVQLEVGSKATEYVHENYGQTLAKCQRYYHAFNYGADSSFLYLNQINPSLRAANGYWPVQMRAQPTLTSTLNSGTVANALATEKTYYFQVASAYNAAQSYFLYALTADAEL